LTSAIIPNVNNSCGRWRRSGEPTNLPGVLASAGSR